MPWFKCVILLFLILFFPSLSFAEPKNQQEKKPYICEKCHGIPPLDNQGNNKFHSGAHLIHKEIKCGDCHNSSDGPEHQNGVIEIRPDINYDLGTKIPWPGAGGGFCGGDKTLPMPLGCHSDIIEMKCYWMPGRECKAASAP